MKVTKKVYGGVKDLPIEMIYDNKLLTPVQFSMFFRMCTTLKMNDNRLFITAKTMSEICRCTQVAASTALTKYKRINIMQKEGDCYYVNPSVYYAGSEENEIKACCIYDYKFKHRMVVK